MHSLITDDALPHGGSCRVLRVLGVDFDSLERRHGDENLHPDLETLCEVVRTS